MRKQIVLGIATSIVAAAACGCGSSGTDTAKSTPGEKKDFGGGQMPADARQKFEDSQKQSNQRIADSAAKAKADAMAGKN